MGCPPDDWGFDWPGGPYYRDDAGENEERHGPVLCDCGEHEYDADRERPPVCMAQQCDVCGEMAMVTVVDDPTRCCAPCVVDPDAGLARAQARWEAARRQACAAMDRINTTHVKAPF